MNSLTERLKIAAQEANRINALPAPEGRNYPVRLELGFDVLGVVVKGTRGQGVSHRHTVPWTDVENSTTNAIVTRIGTTVEILTA